MDLEGRLSLNRYFADITMKKEIANTALFEFQVIVADFILVSVLFFQPSPDFQHESTDLSLVLRVETPLVDLRSPRSGMDRSMEYAVLCLSRGTGI